MDTGDGLVGKMAFLSILPAVTYTRVLRREEAEELVVFCR